MSSNPKEPLKANEVQYFSEEEFLSQYSKILSIASNLTSPSYKPQAYILGGQPGSGKTNLHRKILIMHSTNVFLINGDDFRKYHPNFSKIQQIYGDLSSFTQTFANKVTEKMICDLSQKKLNLIIERTLRTSSIPIKTAQLLKSRGYETKLYIMAVKSEISYESTILRYENALGEIPRATAKEHHDLVVNSIVNNLDEIYQAKVFDDIQIFNRNGEFLYSSKTNSISPTIIENNILRGNWNQFEKKHLQDIIVKVRELKVKRIAPDLSEYVLRTNKLLENILFRVDDSWTILQFKKIYCFLFVVFLFSMFAIVSNLKL